MKKRKKKSNRKIFGKELTIDLKDCDPKTIRSAKKIKEYAAGICKEINIKPYGKTIVERFALHIDYAAGYSLVQLIQSSLVSAHFSELWNRAYINLFSCSNFDKKRAVKFSKKFFKARVFKQKTSIR
ncbi:MAG: S-adenosylmethionine decarboxylase [Candidatus Pacebacteria bacterium]|nr:S-adenosylmethionine decarboxylase [Candidatus Paceibacterota bacterium]